MNQRDEVMRRGQLLRDRGQEDQEVTGRKLVPREYWKKKRHTVASRVNVIRKLWHSHFESRLYGSHDLLVSLRRYKGNCQTLCPESTSTTVNIDISKCGI
jgi:hypothetical protein